MLKLGIDLGTSTVKLLLMEEQQIKKQWIKPHYGHLTETLKQGLQELMLPPEVTCCISGSNSRRLLDLFPSLEKMEEIPAIVEGVRYLAPGCGSVIEIGSQSARFITELNSVAPRFSANEHCAGGTGSFFEDQMSRLGLKMEDYSTLVDQAESIPSLSGRCAVFAKTDIIHHQQEGIPSPDILAGLCYAMIRNYKATIVRNLPVEKPVAFCGGLTCNTGVIRAIKELFRLKEEELVIPENARMVVALGAALHAERETDTEQLIASLDMNRKEKNRTAYAPLVLEENTILRDPDCTEQPDPEGVYLGIDVGSTSTDLVLTGKEKELIDFQYLRTAGDPEKAVRTGMKKIERKYGKLRILGVGITGSGRDRLGRMMGADAIRDEITAQATAAVHFFPQADTVFEIGGQDSKFISLKQGQVSDFQMNKICAAGTGSFVEEQAARMNIPISEFGPLALQSKTPWDLGERCTVFIETSIAQAEAEGASRADIAAGLCYSIVKNYLHKVVGEKQVGEHIVLQGGVDYNPGIVAAFQNACPGRVTVSPVFSISGAYGAALLAQEATENKATTFLGFDFPSVQRKAIVDNEQIRKNREFYRKAGQLMAEDYDGRIDPTKKTVGVPLTLIMFKFFPLANAFFRSLGYNVILSHPSNEETIRLAQESVRGEMCYPVKLLSGHMLQLAKQKVDYIFLPQIHTIRHPHSHAKHNYACPYMQVAAKVVYENLGLKGQGIELLSPVLDLDLGAQMMGKAMLDTGKQLGFSKPRCLPGLLKGAKAVMTASAGVEKLGKEVLDHVKPEDKILVLITRNYGISDPVLNMGIPELLLERGYKVLTLGHLPGMDLDISSDYPDMYWPFGDHLLSGAKLIAHHPNLYAVYLTNHGCGPDTLISTMFKEEMGDKPYLQIEVDEHFSKVGVITRIEAFLNSISHRPAVSLPKDFDLKQVMMKPARMQEVPDRNKKLMIPDLGDCTAVMVDYYRQLGYDAHPMPAFDKGSLMLGRGQMVSKEYLPLPMLVGSCLRALGKTENEEDLQFLIPMNYGADADGQYARALRTILDRLGHTRCMIITPLLEEVMEKAENPQLLTRALLTMDLIRMLPVQKRQELSVNKVLSEQELITLAGSIKSGTRKIAVTGSPLCMLSLNEGVLDTLQEEGWTLSPAPLSEMLWFLWKDNGKTVDRSLMDSLHQIMKENSPFSEDPEELFAIADRKLKSFAANQGRYRYAKAVQISKKVSAVLALAPRYENTQRILQLSGLMEECSCPCFELSLDGDWDENSASKLRSFLYYCHD